VKITRHGEKVAEINPIKTGEAAPDFSLTDLSGNTITLSKLSKPVLISTFPDINTRVCSLQTQRFNVEASKHEGIDFLSISNNTKEEQKNWCAAEGVDMTILSDDGQFSKAYGIFLESTQRLARTIFVLKDGKVLYSEIVTELTDEPDYSKALEAAEKAE
jgi:thiol peroxidase